MAVTQTSPSTAKVDEALPYTGDLRGHQRLLYPIGLGTTDSHNQADHEYLDDG
jgi:hypothetical protein